MPYCTKTDIEKMIPAAAVTQLTDDEGTGAQISSRVSEAIAQADSEIDAYCASIYTIPFSPVPDLVRKFSVDIAIYHLYSRRLEEMPEVRYQRYKDAIKQLEDIAKGLMSLGEQPVPAQVAGGSILTNRSYDDRIFTRETLKGY